MQSGPGVSAPVAVVRRFERWPICTCPVCVSLDMIYPEAGQQLGFWRYVPATAASDRYDLELHRHHVVRRLRVR